MKSMNEFDTDEIIQEIKRIVEVHNAGSVSLDVLKLIAAESLELKFKLAMAQKEDRERIEVTEAYLNRGDAEWPHTKEDWSKWMEGWNFMRLRELKMQSAVQRWQMQILNTVATLGTQTDVFKPSLMVLKIVKEQLQDIYRNTTFYVDSTKPSPWQYSTNERIHYLETVIEQLKEFIEGDEITSETCNCGNIQSEFGCPRCALFGKYSRLASRALLQKKTC